MTKLERQNKVLEKTLDIALFHIVDNIKGLKTLAEKREKKAQLKHIFMEVAEYILKDKKELEDEPKYKVGTIAYYKDNTGKEFEVCICEIKDGKYLCWGKGFTSFKFIEEKDLYKKEN